MAKLILLVAVVAAVYLLLRGYARSVGHRDVKADAPAEAREEDMVQCRHCGVHLPRSEAVTYRDDLYCSEEHRRLNDRS